MLRLRVVFFLSFSFLFGFSFSPESASAATREGLSVQECTDRGGTCTDAGSDGETCPEGNTQFGVCSGWLDSEACCAQSAEAPTDDGISVAECQRRGGVCTDSPGNGETCSGGNRQLGVCGGWLDSEACCAQSEEDEDGNLVNPNPERVAAGIAYTPLERLPFVEGTGDLSSYYEGFFRLFMIIVVLGAVFMIVIGGFLYLTSGGNTAQIGSARKIITSALMGLVLALVSVLILNLINPDLTSLRLTFLTPVSVPTDEAGGGAGTPASSARAWSASNQTGQSGTGAATTCSQPLVPITGVSAGIEGGEVNLICPALLSKLQQIKAAAPGLNFRVTRTMGGAAQSRCHRQGQGRDGTCADIALVPNPGFHTARWDELCRAADSVSGISVLNEVSNTRGCTEALGPFVRTKNQTGAHLHINLIE